MLDEARAHAEWNVTRLAPWVERGVPVVGLEPSCLLTLRDEYVDLLRTDAARAVARSSYLLEEFLLRERARGLDDPVDERRPAPRPPARPLPPEGDGGHRAHRGRARLGRVRR